jgi:hypothetical protein
MGTLAICGLRAAAQTGPSADAQETARELFSVTFDGAMAQLNTQGVDYVWPSVEAALIARNPRLDAATLAGLRAEYERIRLARMHELMKDIPDIYARYLTAPEMRELTAFYRTPTGGKLLTVLPKIMTEAFSAVLPRMPTLAADTQEAFLKLLHERGHLK